MEHSKQDELSNCEEIFCTIYAKCFDAPKAYSKAFGTDLNKSKAEASKLIEKESIRERIKQIKASRFNREMIDADDVIGMYIKIAFADVTDYIEFGKKTQTDEDGNEVVVNEVNLKNECGTDFEAAPISSISNSKTGWKVNFYDRMKALEWLSKHLGLDEEKENTQTQTGIIILPSVNDGEKEKGE